MDPDQDLEDILDAIEAAAPVRREAPSTYVPGEGMQQQRQPSFFAVRQPGPQGEQPGFSEPHEMVQRQVDAQRQQREYHQQLANRKAWEAAEAQRAAELQRVNEHRARIEARRQQAAQAAATQAKKRELTTDTMRRAEELRALRARIRYLQGK